MIKFIADIGSNHNQNITRTFELISAAKNIGCWGVKFQLFAADMLWRDREVAGKMKNRQLPEHFIPQISKCCQARELTFGCTPFNLRAVEILKPYVAFLKIGSYEILWHKLIEACAATGLPIILSTGMATIKEIIAAVNALIVNRVSGETKEDLILLHCNSNYPAQSSQCDMTKIENLRELFLRDSGWSDHTRNPGVIYNAVAKGAVVVEFHLDLEDGKGFEFEHGHCWKPSEMGEVIKNVNSWKESDRPIDVSKFDELRAQRTDPSDGMRPLRQEKQK
jgi:N-acetylneuraminate synthase